MESTRARGFGKSTRLARGSAPIAWWVPARAVLALLLQEAVEETTCVPTRVGQRQRQRQRDRETERQRDRGEEGEGERERGREEETEREKKRERERKREREERERERRERERKCLAEDLSVVIIE